MSVKKGSEDNQQQDVNQAQDVVHMDVQADDDDCMAQMGYIYEQRPHLQGCELAVSPRVSSEVASESIKMLFMFGNLRRLQLRFDFDDITITQQMVCAVAELLQLTSLHLLHGSLQPEADLSHWTSLRHLEELKLLPGEEGGIRGEQMEQLTSLSSSLTSLSLRPHPQAVSTDSLWHLAAGMEQLQELSLCPVPDACAAPDLQHLLEMPHLSRLQLGTSNAAQVLMLSEVKVPRRSPQLSLVVRDACEPGPAADVLTIIGWTLPQHLTSLCIGPLAAPCPNDVLVTLATLTNLQSLQLQLVAPPGQHVTGTVELLSLSPCRKLTCLEVLTSSRLYVPFTLKTVSLATLAWPNLAALRLSLAGKRELMPEALDMCDNFKALKELQLFSPLEDTPLEDMQLQASTAAETASAAARSSWAGWAAASLSSLGLFSGTANGAANISRRSSTGAGAPDFGHTSNTGLLRGGSGVSSPLVHDMQQRNLVQQQHWRQHEVAHQQHMQAQHTLHDAAAAHSHHSSLATLQDKQLLPAAVGSFQQHKLLRADSLFGKGGGGDRDGVGQEGLSRQGSEAWSPTWLLKSFVPFGSPASPSALSNADSMLQQQRPTSWGLLDACRGGMPRAASLDPANQALWPSQQPYTGSRLQHSSSNAGGAIETQGAGSIRRAATISGDTAADLMQPHLAQDASQLAVSAPGTDLAMYRAAGRLLPLNLNYMPNSLTKLCLQSYHLVAIGMPDPAAYSSSVTTAAGTSQTDQQQEQQDDIVQSATQQDDQQQGNDPEQQQQDGCTMTAHGAGQVCNTAVGVSSTPDVQVPPADPEQVVDGRSETEGEGISATQHPVRAAVTEAGAAATPLSDAGQRAACSPGGIMTRPGAGPASAVSLAFRANPVLPQLPLPHLLHLELDSCRIDDETMAALLKSSPALRTLEIAGLEGLTDAGLSHISSLQHLTRLCVEAEETTGVSLASLSAVRRLHRLKKLHWCSRDSLHGPLDTDMLTAQLSGLTGLRQLVLLVAPDSEAYAMSGWMVVLQRRLPLCRLVLRRELLMLDAWSDVPEEDGF